MRMRVPSAGFFVGWSCTWQTMENLPKRLCLRNKTNMSSACLRAPTRMQNIRWSYLIWYTSHAFPWISYKYPMIHEYPMNLPWIWMNSPSKMTFTTFCPPPISFHVVVLFAAPATPKLMNLRSASLRSNRFHPETSSTGAKIHRFWAANVWRILIS